MLCATHNYYHFNYSKCSSRTMLYQDFSCWDFWKLRRPHHVHPPPQPGYITCRDLHETSTCSQRNNYKRLNTLGYCLSQHSKAQNGFLGLNITLCIHAVIHFFSEKCTSMATRTENIGNYFDYWLLPLTPDMSLAFIISLHHASDQSHQTRSSQIHSEMETRIYKHCLLLGAYELYRKLISQTLFIKGDILYLC